MHSIHCFETRWWIRPVGPVHQSTKGKLQKEEVRPTRSIRGWVSLWPKLQPKHGQTWLWRHRAKRKQMKTDPRDNGNARLWHGWRCAVVLHCCWVQAHFIRQHPGDHAQFARTSMPIVLGDFLGPVFRAYIRSEWVIFRNLLTFYDPHSFGELGRCIFLACKLV